MSKNKATGTILKVFAAKQLSEKFTKREFVLEIEDGKYMQTVLFEAVGDKCAELDGLKRGDEVDVDYNLRGREWTSPTGDVKYFNTLVAWKIKRAGATQQASHDPGPAGDDPLAGL